MHTPRFFRVSSRLVAAVMLLCCVVAAAGRPAFAASPAPVDDVQVTSVEITTRPVAIGNQVFYVQNTPDYGLALWVTDGTKSGTRLLTHGPKADAAVNPLGFAALDGALYFVATNDNHGAELWRSDGTSDGTVMVRDIIPGSASGAPGGGHELMPFKGKLFFVGNDGTNGSELWQSDGTRAGTTMTKDIGAAAGGGSPTGLSVVGDALWFLAYDGVHGWEPWKSDGTAAGTAMVADTVPGASGTGIQTIFQGVNGKVFFSIDDATHNAEPWISDGTSEGTKMITDLQPGSYAGFLGSGVSFGSFALFRGQDGNGRQGPISTELWRTDGTAAGTTLVKDVDPDGIAPPFAGKTFFAADDGQHGKEPWVSDGTVAGTHMIKDIDKTLINTGETADGVVLADGVDIAGIGYFSGSDGVSNAGIWRTDGTAVGTYPVNGDNKPSRGFGFTSANGLIVFMGTSYLTPGGVQRIMRIGVPTILTSSGAGAPVEVAGFARNASEMQRSQPFGAFGGGATSAQGDINGDGVADLIVGAGPGGGPHVLVLSGKDDSVLRSFYAYPSAFTGGVFVAAGDVDGDGRADIITGAGAGGGPHVQVFSGVDNASLRSFFVYPDGFSGGVRVAAGDVDGDGRADIITGAGAGGGPHVQAFSGADNHVLRSFFAYDASFSSGVYVAAGDIDNDGQSEIITGAGAGGGPHVQAFAQSGVIRSFFAYAPNFTGGVRVAVAHVDADARADIITGPGPGGGPHVQVFSGQPSNAVIDSFFAYSPSFAGGVFPASAR